MAMSVPVPMAMPTSASASAGASLMPSPTKATRAVAGRRRLHRLDLAVGQNLGHDLVDAERARDRLGGAAVVAGDHRDLAGPAPAAPRSPRGVDGLIGSATAMMRGEPAVDGGIERALALRAEARGRVGEGRPTSMPSFAMKRSAPTSTLRPLDLRRDAEAGHGLEASTLGASAGRAARAAATMASRDRMLGAALDRRDQAQDLGSPRSPAATTRSVSSGRPSRQGAGLVEGDDLDRPCSACSASPLRNSTPSSAAAARADHDRGRRRQAHGAGAGDDQHRDRIDQREGQRPARAEDQPDQEGQGGGRHHGRHEPHRHPVDQRLDRQLRALRLLRPCG